MKKLLLMLALFACKKENKYNILPYPRKEQPLEEFGKELYSRYCMSCHNMNPTKAGSMGPDLWGSNYELVYLRVKYLLYPKDYTPKRSTMLMIKFPYLTDENIQAIYEFLNQEKEYYK